MGFYNKIKHWESIRSSFEADKAVIEIPREPEGDGVYREVDLLVRDFIDDLRALEECYNKEKATLPINIVTHRALQMKIEKLEAENKLLAFMVENGLGEQDMLNDITHPHEL